MQPACAVLFRLLRQLDDQRRKFGVLKMRGMFLWRTAVRATRRNKSIGLRAWICSSVKLSNASAVIASCSRVSLLFETGRYSGASSYVTGQHACGTVADAQQLAAKPRL